MRKIFFVVFIFLFITSCSSVPKRLTSNPPLGKYEALGEGRCTSCSLIFLGFIPIMWRGMTTRAYNGAVRSRGGDDLINPAIKEFWYYTPLGHLRCTKVSGTVIMKK